MEKIKFLLESSESILILAHKSPDGDAVGSGLALYNALLNQNKNVDIILEDIPRIFDFLPNIDKIKDSSKVDNYDLVIVVDCATQERIGQDNNYFENAKYTLNIDHHISNTNYANYNYVSLNTPACCQYMVEIFDFLGIEITKEIAECLMVGILTDTGGFQYDNVGEKTFNYSSRFSKLVDIPSIYKKVLATRTKVQFELSKIAISRMEFLNDDRVTFTYLMEEDFNKFNAGSGDYEGIVNIGREIEGVEVSVFVRQKGNSFKVSLRSNTDFSVNDVALLFNGGGHVKSAGFDSDLEFDELKEKLLDCIVNGMK